MDKRIVLEQTKIEQEQEERMKGNKKEYSFEELTKCRMTKEEFKKFWGFDNTD